MAIKNDKFKRKHIVKIISLNKWYFKGDIVFLSITNLIFYPCFDKFSKIKK
jgi:hypothetical protein